MIRVNGFAAPFNKPNIFNETLLPQAFDEFHFNGLPILIQHKEYKQVGIWDKFDTKPSGVFVSGLVNNDAAEHAIEAGEFQELSINYHNIDYEKKISRALDEGNFFLAMDIKREDSREGRFDDHKLDQLREEFWNNFHNTDDREFTKFVEQRIGDRTSLYRPLIVKRASLFEISLVERGAYRGTHYDWRKV